jgi:tetratricopeptide (TPR) repeat protein
MIDPMSMPSSRSSVLRLPKRLAVVTVVLLSLSACSYQDQYIENECPLPESQLMAPWRQWQEARARPGGCGSLEDGTYTCQQQRREVERIAYICPSYVPGLMASAILAYDDRQYARAQQFLDALFWLQKVHPPAAVLRGRIAMEEGNLPFSQRFLAEQVKLAPEDAELREVYAAALYLSGKLPQAQAQLNVAANLGAPVWRVAYHRGLLEEVGGNLHQAIQHYEEALRERPDWDVALARRDGILAVMPPHLKPRGLSQTPSGVLPKTPA